MAVASREQLKQYALRALGAPVLEINVDDDQLEDRLDEALDYWRLYHYEGIEQIYLKQQIRASEIVLSTAVELGTPYATVTTPGLTWIRKSSKSVLSSFSNVDAQTMEIWYAINTSGSTINETTAITYSGNYDDAAAVALTYSGVDLASPWA